jgi:hypothetical protein
MTLNHGHFAHDNETEKLRRKSQVALAHAADCRKQLVYIDVTSGKLTNLASASVGPFPSSDIDFRHCGKASFVSWSSRRPSEQNFPCQVSKVFSLSCGLRTLHFWWLSGLLSSPGVRGCNLNCHSQSLLWV